MDIDGDSQKDLLIAGFSGFVHVSKALGNGDFSIPERLTFSDGSEVHGGQYMGVKDKWVSEKDATLGIQPRLVDWDADGDLDLLMGGRNGVLKIFRNQGSKTEMKLNKQSFSVEVDGKPAYAPGERHRRNPSPQFVDWDNDGKKDLVIFFVKQKQVIWHRNLGTSKTPKFAKEQTLLDFSKSKPEQSNRLSIADFNGDGKLDLVIGGGYYISSKNPSSGMWVFVQK